MPKRPTNPKPDPKKSMLLCSRPVFRDLSSDPSFFPWLPDATPALHLPEQQLEAEDEISVLNLPPRPPDALLEDMADIPRCASLIAQWTFDAYCALVKHRLHVYNKYRKLIDGGDNTPLTLGRYRRACRLACEQIVRRDLPPEIGGPNFYETMLPIFDIDLRVERDAPDGELAKQIFIKAVAEVRQRRHSSDMLLTGEIVAGASAASQQQWSSSSSSSSSSSMFDPG